MFNARPISRRFTITIVNGRAAKLKLRWELRAARAPTQILVNAPDHGKQTLTPVPLRPAHILCVHTLVMWGARTQIVTKIGVKVHMEVRIPVQAPGSYQFTTVSSRSLSRCRYLQGLVTSRYTTFILWIILRYVK